MSLFLWRRVYGLAQITDGLVAVFTPWRTGLPLRAAKRMAGRRYKTLCAIREAERQEGDAVFYGPDGQTVATVTLARGTHIQRRLP